MLQIPAYNSITDWVQSLTAASFINSGLSYESDFVLKRLINNSNKQTNGFMSLHHVVLCGPVLLTSVLCPRLCHSCICPMCHRCIYAAPCHQMMCPKQQHEWDGNQRSHRWTLGMKHFSTALHSYVRLFAMRCSVFTLEEGSGSRLLCTLIWGVVHVQVATQSHYW